ncbi:P-loop containing nucleoside triphosphate hydrolase protein [Pisolithus marmoratus]|nr:P-loop containing nucleoside triphosphate hydrolase protein [Pisolithus marmoratus]
MPSATFILPPHAGCYVKVRPTEYICGWFLKPFEEFGHSGYKGKQKEIIEAAISGSDVFVLAPTGMGKSLCFQLPSIASGVSHAAMVAKSLPNQQVRIASLREKGVAAVSLTSDTGKKDKAKIFTDLSSPRPKIRLLYTTPERLCTQDVTQLLAMVYKNGFLNRLVVDEAHCISEWGHDFREEYRKLGTFRDNFPRVPVMALTATATDNVRDDIISSLKMIEDRLYTAVHPSNRANLFYEIRYASGEDSLARKSDIFEFISTLYKRRGSPSCGIIYCRLRQTCDELSHFLTAKGLKARPYHRGIKLSDLDETLKGWQAGGTEKGNVDVDCATVAFGMGIDKGDVRYIMHYDLPKSFEGYYQETGRAGRDGMPSRCVLYYSREDAWRVRSLLSRSHAKRQDAARVIGGPEPSQRTGDSFQGLADYAEDVTTCRHVLICKYFGETIDTADEEMMKSLCDKMCDVGGPHYLVLLTVYILSVRSADTRRSSCKYRRFLTAVTSQVTRAYSSASSLKKPFKVPFKTPFKTVEPVPLPKVNVELEASFSQKIPLSVRMKAFGSIRQALYEVMDNGGYCNKLQEFATALPTNTEARYNLLMLLNAHIEFCAQTMSATQPGYDDRVNQKLCAIRRLGAIGEANEDENEMEVVQAVKEALDEWTT